VAREREREGVRGGQNRGKESERERGWRCVCDGQKRTRERKREREREKGESKRRCLAYCLLQWTSESVGGELEWKVSPAHSVQSPSLPSLTQARYHACTETEHSARLSLYINHLPLRPHPHLPTLSVSPSSSRILLSGPFSLSFSLSLSLSLSLSACLPACHPPLLSKHAHFLFMFNCLTACLLVSLYSPPIQSLCSLPFPARVPVLFLVYLCRLCPWTAVRDRPAETSLPIVL